MNSYLNYSAIRAKIGNIWGNLRKIPDLSVLSESRTPGEHHGRHENFGRITVGTRSIGRGDPQFGASGARPGKTPGPSTSVARHGAIRIRKRVGSGCCAEATRTSSGKQEQDCSHGRHQRSVAFCDGSPPLLLKRRQSHTPFYRVFYIRGANGESFAITAYPGGQRQSVARWRKGLVNAFFRSRSGAAGMRTSNTLPFPSADSIRIAP